MDLAGSSVVVGFFAGQKIGSVVRGYDVDDLDDGKGVPGRP